jgi:hypothetical protein
MLAPRLGRELSDPYKLAKAIAFLVISYLTLAVILPSTLATWQEAHTAGKLDVTPKMRRELVGALADKVSRRYLDAGKAARVAAALRQAERDKEYDGISSPGQFARLLTSELQRLSDDQHMQVVFAPEGAPVSEERNFPPPYKDEQSLPGRLVDRLGRYLAKFGVEEATQSDAGIAYLRIDGFAPPHLSAEKFAAAMDRLAGSRALIVDLRHNSGGSRDGVALLASYFFDRPTLLSEVVAPRSGERLQMWTRGKVDGAHYGSARPVYILTSHATFSAGEDFAYAMQTRKRAIVVGETTRGGAHPMAPFRLSPYFLALIPVAESISPITHTNWEGAGVRPDIAMPAASARNYAAARAAAQAAPVR